MSTILYVLQFHKLTVVNRVKVCRSNCSFLQASWEQIWARSSTSHDNSVDSFNHLKIILRLLRSLALSAGDVDPEHTYDWCVTTIITHNWNHCHYAMRSLHDHKLLLHNSNAPSEDKNLHAILIEICEMVKVPNVLHVIEDHSGSKILNTQREGTACERPHRKKREAKQLPLPGASVHLMVTIRLPPACHPPGTRLEPACQTEITV